MARAMTSCWISDVPSKIVWVVLECPTRVARCCELRFRVRPVRRFRSFQPVVGMKVGMIFETIFEEWVSFDLVVGSHRAVNLLPDRCRASRCTSPVTSARGSSSSRVLSSVLGSLHPSRASCGDRQLQGATSERQFCIEGHGVGASARAASPGFAQSLK